MQVKVYNGERQERWKWWYINFFTFFVFLIVVSLLTNNIVGAFLLIFLLGWYILFSFLATKQKLLIVLQEQGLTIGEKFYPYTSFVGFVLEIDQKDQLLRNIVFVTPNSKTIYTFEDEAENIRDFVLVLSETLELLPDYNRTFVDNMIRRLKL